MALTERRTLWFVRVRVYIPVPSILDMLLEHANSLLHVIFPDELLQISRLGIGIHCATF
jgi:hypothetical protein